MSAATVGPEHEVAGAVGKQAARSRPPDTLSLMVSVAFDFLRFDHPAGAG
jgi:hypothetical protein